MTDKKFWLGFVAVFVVVSAFGFLVHGLWIAPEYAKLTGVMRGEEDQMAHMHWMLIAHLLMALAFVWIYRQGRKDGDWLGQGLRFGLAMAVFANIPFFLIYHSVAQFPFDLTLMQIVGDTAASLAMGLTVAFVHK
jgi:hypothetical protein